MKTKIFGLVIIAIFSLSVITGAFATDIPSIKVQQLDLKLNEEFGIGLSSNPSTGYCWVCDYDPEYIQITNDQYIPDESKIIGSGGTHIYGFKALKTGETQVVLKYMRPWEKYPPEETIIYDIKITK